MVELVRMYGRLMAVMLTGLGMLEADSFVRSIITAIVTVFVVLLIAS